jgi:nitrogen fixation protein NifU and related proteins
VATITKEVHVKELTFYKEQVIDHYKHPRYKARLKSPTVTAALYNAACGDSVIIDLSIEDNTIINIGFEGVGCVISLAAASMLCQELFGKSIMQASQFLPEQMGMLIGMTLGPVRLKCALLPLEALHKALKLYKESKTHAQ